MRPESVVLLQSLKNGFIFPPPLAEQQELGDIQPPARHLAPDIQDQHVILARLNRAAHHEEGGQLPIAKGLVKSRRGGQMNGANGQIRQPQSDGMLPDGTGNHLTWRKNSRRKTKNQLDLAPEHVLQSIPKPLWTIERDEIVHHEKGAHAGPPSEPSQRSRWTGICIGDVDVVAPIGHWTPEPVPWPSPKETDSIRREGVPRNSLCRTRWPAAITEPSQNGVTLL